MKSKHVLLALAAAFLLGSCATPNVAYFSDIAPGTTE